MGNCFGSTPVEHHGPETTKYPFPALSSKKSPDGGKAPAAVAALTGNKRSVNTAATRQNRSVPANHAGKTLPATRQKRSVPEIDAGKAVPATRQNRSVTANDAGKTLPATRQNRSVPETDEGEALPATGKIVTPNLKMFTLAALKSATRNFRPDTILGEGGFGRVFKGWVDEKTFAPSRVGVGMAVAVKKSNPDSVQGLHEWQCEVKFLGKFYHPNLVKLLGYCWEDNQFLLVYEYMPRGSLENHLFTRGGEALAWDTRLKIAIGAAQGLSFLHNSEKSVIYRDFKASNILLDSAFNAKLSDFGLAKLGPVNGNSHVTTSVMGTYGYAAPEYLATGHLYVKSDVYGFGVVLLEILTGLRALDTNRPSAQHNLIEWAKPCLSDKRKLKKIMDPRFDKKYPLPAAVQTAQLILICLEPDPKNRPSMEEVLKELRVVRAIKDDNKPKEASQRENRRDRPAHSSRTAGNGRTGE